MYYRARHYDPSAGHWLQRDPIGFEGDSANLHQVMSSNPVSRVDPYGLYDGGTAIELAERVAQVLPKPTPGPTVGPSGGAGGLGPIAGPVIVLVVGAEAIKETKEAADAEAAARRALEDTRYPGPDDAPIPPSRKYPHCLCTWQVRKRIKCKGGALDGLNQPSQYPKNQPEAATSDGECKAKCEGKRATEQATQREAADVTAEQMSAQSKGKCKVTVRVRNRGKGYMFWWSDKP